MRSLRCFLFAACALLAGCATPITLSKEFVTLAGHDTAADFRAVTGDDARVWLRRFEDPNAADLAFWAKSIEYDFVQQRGYDLVAQGDATDADGNKGRWFQCTANVSGDRIGYLIAVWAAGRDVTVVEFAARAEAFEARVEQVKRALHTVDV
ncbi:MAG: hypothetical protein U1E73_04940 [Planctomycetota bacterium]